MLFWKNLRGRKTSVDLCHLFDPSYHGIISPAI